MLIFFNSFDNQPWCHVWFDKLCVYALKILPTENTILLKTNKNPVFITSRLLIMNTWLVFLVMFSYLFFSFSISEQNSWYWFSIRQNSCLSYIFICISKDVKRIRNEETKMKIILARSANRKKFMPLVVLNILHLLWVGILWKIFIYLLYFQKSDNTKSKNKLNNFLHL